MGKKNWTYLPFVPKLPSTTKWVNIIRFIEGILRWIGQMLILRKNCLKDDFETDFP